MNKLVSVIIPVYNSEKYLERCLQSILNSTYSNLEVILVDDGSIDDSGNICDLYSKRDSRFVVVHKANGGTAVARNEALKMVRGDYIAFLDNDDYISPFFYEYMMRAMEDTDADIVVCETTREDNAEELVMQSYSGAEVVDKHDFILGTYTGKWTRNTTPWNKLYKKELFEEVRFPEGKGYEDAYTTYRLLYKAKSICYLNNTLYCWYQNEESYSSQKDNARKLMFREEALRLQSEFYTASGYEDVKCEAIRFYINQLFFMIWQLDHDYVQSEDTKLVKKQFLKNIKKAHKRYHKTLTQEDNLKILEYIFPVYGAVYRKISGEK